MGSGALLLRPNARGILRLMQLRGAPWSAPRTCGALYAKAAAPLPNGDIKGDDR